MQSELENAKQAADQAKAQATELAKRAASLNSELEKANAQRNELQTKLDQATSEITSAQSQLEDKQPGLGGMQSELENAKQAADQAKAQGTELAKRAASLNSELEKANVQRYMVDPGNAGRQSDLAASYVKVGDFLMAQGNLVQALKWYRDGLAVGLAGADRLAKADPENAVWQHNLSLSYSRVGDVLMAQGNLAEALKSYQDGLAVADRLAKSDPENAALAARCLHFIQKDRRCDSGQLSKDLAIFDHSIAKLEQASVSEPVSVKTVPGVASPAQDVGEKRRRLSQTRALTHPQTGLDCLACTQNQRAVSAT